MKTIFLFLAFTLSIVSCSEESAIQYREFDSNLYFENEGIKLVINNTMGIQVSYFNGEITQTMVSEQEKPNDYLLIYGEEVGNFVIEKKTIIYRHGTSTLC